MLCGQAQYRCTDYTGYARAAPDRFGTKEGGPDCENIDTGHLARESGRALNSNATSTNQLACNGFGDTQPRYRPPKNARIVRQGGHEIHCKSQREGRIRALCFRVDISLG